MAHLAVRSPGGIGGQEGKGVFFPLVAEDVEALLRALPFAIGAEHVDGKWIAAVFCRLLKLSS